jgi:allantoate deiminase
MDEEGPRFRTGHFGSLAFAGGDLAGLDERRDEDGVSLAEAMRSWGLDFARAGEASRIAQVGAYLELHIEQGPVLEARGIDVGIVTGIVGLRWYDVRLVGAPGHAGAAPMSLRRDAFAGAARGALALREEILRRPGASCNVGAISLQPGAVNIVPGVAEFVVDVRAATRDVFDELPTVVRDALGQAATAEGLELELTERVALPPVPMAAELMDTLERCAAALGASTLRLPSGAGHDAQVIAEHVPAAMVFVPCRGGVSHSPDELADPAHCELGARVLAAALESLAG